jgi:membrane protease YdiL (CAAX protease family)
MSYPLSTINTIILSYSILFLLFTTFLSIQPIYFAEAQNSTNAQNNTNLIFSFFFLSVILHHIIEEIIHRQHKLCKNDMAKKLEQIHKEIIQSPPNV